MSSPKPTAPAPALARPPHKKARPGSCDTHVHLLAAANEFPLYEGRAEDPPSGHTFQEWIRLYRRHLENLGCTRGVIVHSIFYGTDNSVTVAALREMGAGFRGIGLLPDQASEADLDQFVAWNMAGVRLNYVHGGVLSWQGAKAMAPKLADRGLHIQMLMHAHLHMNELQPDLQSLPVPVCFDHIGWPDLTLGTGNAGLEALYQMLDSGKVWIKLSGLYRLANAPYFDTDEIVSRLVRANPERCLWGSDWPHIMLNGAEMPDAGSLMDAFYRVVSDEKARDQILIENPKKLYGFAD